MSEFKRLLHYTKGHRALFSAAILGVGINSFLNTYFIAVLLQSVANALIVKTSQAVLQSVFSLVPLLCMCIFLKLYSDFFIGKVCSYAAMQMRKDIISKLLGSEVGSLSEKNSGDIISTFTSDVPVAFENLADIVSVPVRALFLGVGGIIYIFAADARLALLTLGTGIFIFIYSLFFAGRMRKISDMVLRWRAAEARNIKELLDGFITIHMYQIQNIIADRYHDVIYRVKKHSKNYGFVSGILGGVNNFVFSAFSKAIIFGAGMLVLSDKFDVPMMLKIAQMAGGVAGVFNVSRILTDTQAAINGSRRVFAFIDHIKPEQSRRDYGSMTVSQDTDKCLAFENVSFGYIEQNNVLSDVSFTLPSNTITVFIGESGSGKTTILRLLQALYRPLKGKITLGGMNIEDINLHELRMNMSYVPQEPLLFEGTIKENISIGTDIDLEKLLRVAKQAGIHTFIESLPQKYDTVISEGGLSLSGGERQRVALARAFYRDAPILILDEVTASIDNKNEEIIYYALKEYKKNHTILFSTHRQSAFNIADKIYKIECGELIEVMT